MKKGTTRKTLITAAVLALIFAADYLLNDRHPSGEAEEPLSEMDSLAADPASHVDLMSRIEIPFRLEDSKEDIVEHMGYTLSYNSGYRIPNWVAYELLSTELVTGNRSREDKFTPDPSIKGRQAYDRDYSGSGYDRGHMAPAADMKWSSQAMKESFYLSNVCPQLHGLNAGAWNDLEQQVRYEAKYYGSVWVVCGPLFDTATPRNHIGENHVMVPDSFFKALLARKKDGTGYVAIGFIFPNENCTRNLTLYAMTVDELEARTGMDFFHNLETSAQEAAESVMDPFKDWRIKDQILRD